MEDATNTSANRWQTRAQRLLHDRRTPLLIGALLMLIALAVLMLAAPQRFTAVFDSLVAVDLEQSRIDTALPTPNGEQWLGQRIIPRHDGLTEIEITLLRYGDPVAGEDGSLTLQLLDEAGLVLAEKRLSTGVIAHNQVERLSFPVLADSAGQRYLLRLSGSPENKVSAWGYSLDVYKDGSVELGGQTAVAQDQAAAQDMRFTTRYQLTWTGALGALGEALFYEGALLALALIFLPLPGVLLLYLYRRMVTRGGAGKDGRQAVVWDPAAWWGAALALGVAAWPILWLWSTVLGIHWGSWSLAALLAGGWTGAAWLWWRERGRELLVEDTLVHWPLARPWRWSHLALAGVLLGGLAVRLLAVRDVSFLPWVDASRHGLITAVMAANGQVIRDYAPYLPVDRFPYHFGFHTLSSSLYLLSGWPLERLLLYLGQLLSALVPLTMFTAVWLLLRRERAALLASFLVALPFFFPAYYTTWGRMTQLTAVLILPLLLAFSWQLVRGKGGWTSLWPLLGLLLAGLFLIHVRVFIYFLPFPLLVWLVSRLRNTRWLAAAGGLAFALALPHLLHLAADANQERPLGGTIPDYNVFPINYVTTGWEQYFLGVAALGLLVLLLGAWRRRSWVILPAVLIAWAGLLIGLLYSDRLGVPLPSLFNLNSMYIILFVPLAMYLAIVVDQIWVWLAGRARPWQWVGYGLSGALLMALLVFGVRQQVAILNPQTLLALPEDVPALRWLEENLPQEAVIAVNSWRWLGETRAASDGGAWILPLTGRAVSTPPIDHIYSAELFANVRAFNEAATAVTDWSDPAQAAWLREQGITHIFVGKRGGFFDPAKLQNNERMEMLFDRDGVFIFAVRE